MGKKGMSENESPARLDCKHVSESALVSRSKKNHTVAVEVAGGELTVSTTIPSGNCVSQMTS
jgi:hypothetical protein